MAGTSSSLRRRPWSLADTYGFIATYLSKIGTRPAYLPALAPSHFEQTRSFNTLHSRIPHSNTGIRFDTAHKQASGITASYLNKRHNSLPRRHFHDYFVTHLPSSSLHPDSRSSSGPHHKLPRAESTPHTPGTGPSPAAAPPMVGTSRELTVVRIPLRSAKHHFGVSVSRGSRPYNEDTYQAGTLDIPAFAKRAPITLSRAGPKPTEGRSAGGASGDPQVFYFGVFDGHGGNECSDFLREELHSYVEAAAATFELRSSLKKDNKLQIGFGASRSQKDGTGESQSKENSGKVETKSEAEAERSSDLEQHAPDGRVAPPAGSPTLEGEKPVASESNRPKAIELERSLVAQWKETVGGYFRRFKPEYFTPASSSVDESATDSPVSIEAVLMYAFLKADLDFVTAQARKPDSDNQSDKPLNAYDILGEPAHLAPSKNRIGGFKRFLGGSTASIALISTPTPTPFWHPASPSTLIAAHVGDTRILLCDTATGLAKPLTTNHHPNTPIEGNRLRRYATTFVTDSFGEERMSGLANTRAFGDMRSKRIGVSAEPEIHRIELAPAEYSFMVLISDGVSGTLSDQEIVDVVKEAKTPEQGARDVVSFATEVSEEGDNATCLVVRLGGWERRSEGGMGSMATKEVRDFRKRDALDPRRGRT